MSNPELVYERALHELYPMVRTRHLGAGVDYHLLSLIFVFSTREELFAAVYPADGSCNPDALYAAKLGIDPKRVTPEDIKLLVPYRESFAGVLRAWWVLSGYEEPPCPPNSRLVPIIDLTRK